MGYLKLEVGQVYSHTSTNISKTILDITKDIVKYKHVNPFRHEWTILSRTVVDFEKLVRDCGLVLRSTMQSATNNTATINNYKVGQVYIGNYGVVIIIKDIKMNSDEIHYTIGQDKRVNTTMNIYILNAFDFDEIIKQYGYALQPDSQTPLSVNLNNATISTPKGGIVPSGGYLYPESITQEPPSIGCECGAHKLGNTGKGPAHSTWCPMYERF